MKILLVDDHTILLDGVKSLLSKEDDLTVVGQAGSAEAALEFLKKNEVDLIITDYSLPEMDGLSLVNTIKRIAPNTKVIVLSMHDEVHLVKEILKAGVNGYVLKNDTHKELLNAIRDVSQGKVYLSSDVNKMLITNLN
ncbi:MAG TPA: response regulator transcription factor, partial [Cyclobacteriaceae bacterium]|nr:response regulator transcription factor [Cyclobacteriaceae bacterium]